MQAAQAAAASALTAAGVDPASDAEPLKWQAVLMGTGDEHLERELEFLPRTFPPRAATAVCFDERLAHRLLAAADILVIPSRFEPCGLVALAALRYGAVPVVSSTGGLRDIVSGSFLVAGTGRSQVCSGTLLSWPAQLVALPSADVAGICIVWTGRSSSHCRRYKLPMRKA